MFERMMAVRSNRPIKDEQFEFKGTLPPPRFQPRPGSSPNSKRCPYKFDAFTQKRFWESVRKGTGCWLWMGSQTPSGYGNFQFKKLQIMAHRYSWELEHGELAREFLHVHHELTRRAPI